VHSKIWLSYIKGYRTIYSVVTCICWPTISAIFLDFSQINILGGTPYNRICWPIYSAVTWIFGFYPNYYLFRPDSVIVIFDYYLRLSCTYFALGYPTITKKKTMFLLFLGGGCGGRKIYLMSTPPSWRYLETFFLTHSLAFLYFLRSSNILLGIPTIT